MQFRSNNIVALLLAVSTSTVTAAQKSANLRGGGSNLQEKPFSDPSPSELSSIMNDAANPPLPNLERSLADAPSSWYCPGLDVRVDQSEWCWTATPTCSNTQTFCWSLWSCDCYCY